MHQKAGVSAQNEPCVRLGGKEVSVRGGAVSVVRFTHSPGFGLVFGVFRAGDGQNAGVLRF